MVSLTPAGLFHRIQNLNMYKHMMLGCAWWLADCYDQCFGVLGANPKISISQYYLGVDKKRKVKWRYGQNKCYGMISVWNFIRLSSGPPWAMASTKERFFNGLDNKPGVGESTCLNFVFVLGWSRHEANHRMGPDHGRWPITAPSTFNLLYWLCCYDIVYII